VRVNLCHQRGDEAVAVWLLCGKLGPCDNFIRAQVNSSCASFIQHRAWVTPCPLRVHGAVQALVGVCIYNYRKFSAAITSLDAAGTDIEVAKQSVLIHDFKEFSDFRQFVNAKQTARAAPAVSTLGLFASTWGVNLRSLFWGSPPPARTNGKIVVHIDDAAQALLTVRKELEDSEGDER
jgi:hypothetical protein